MSGCIHKVVCRYKRLVEEACLNEDICKHHSESGPERQKAGKAKKRGGPPGNKKKSPKVLRTGTHTLKKDYTTSNADIKDVRYHLRNYRFRGKLSENQLAAMDAIGAIATKSLTESQREQLLNIFNDMKKAAG